MQTPTNTHRLMQAAGFTIVETGGNCTAWTPQEAWLMCNESIPELLITSDEGPSIPEEGEGWVATLDGEQVASGWCFSPLSVFKIQEVAIRAHLI
jgi:hypothetical protein